MLQTDEEADALRFPLGKYRSNGGAGTVTFPGKLPCRSLADVAELVKDTPGVNGGQHDPLNPEPVGKGGTTGPVTGSDISGVVYSDDSLLR